jgi:hypothetical protein
MDLSPKGMGSVRRQRVNRTWNIIGENISWLKKCL